jgi:hypothetical protein
MVLTSFPTDQGRGKVKVKITGHTVCKPHGYLEPGQEVEVDYSDYLLLKENNKAERVSAPVSLRLGSLEELEAEVLAAGYSPEAAKSIAQRRFEGTDGEGARYLTPQQRVSEALGGDREDAGEEEGEGEGDKKPPAGAGEDFVAQFRESLEKRKKAELVELAKAEFALDLSESSTKDELVEAILKAAAEAKR